MPEKTTDLTIKVTAVSKEAQQAFNSLRQSILNLNKEISSKSSETNKKQKKDAEDVTKTIQSLEKQKIQMAVETAKELERLNREELKVAKSAANEKLKTETELYKTISNAGKILADEKRKIEKEKLKIAQETAKEEKRIEGDLNKALIDGYKTLLNSGKEQSSLKIKLAAEEKKQIDDLIVKHREYTKIIQKESEYAKSQSAGDKKTLLTQINSEIEKRQNLINVIKTENALKSLFATKEIQDQLNKANKILSVENARLSQIKKINQDELNDAKRIIKEEEKLSKDKSVNLTKNAKEISAAQKQIDQERIKSSNDILNTVKSSYATQVQSINQLKTQIQNLSKTYADAQDKIKKLSSVTGGTKEDQTQRKAQIKQIVEEEAKVVKKAIELTEQRKKEIADLQQLIKLNAQRYNQASQGVSKSIKDEMQANKNMFATVQTKLSNEARLNNNLFQEKKRQLSELNKAQKENADVVDKSTGRHMQGLRDLAGFAQNLVRVFQSLNQQILTLGKGSFDTFLNFENTTRSINAVALESEAVYKKVIGGIREIAKQKEIVQTPTQIAEGMIDIVQSGYGAEKALKLVGITSKVATAGLTDTATATKGVIQLMNVYGQKTLPDAQRYADLLFQTQKVGVVTIKDLATQLSGVTSIAAIAGIEFEEVAAAFAVMTKAGLSAAESETAIANMIRGFLKPQENVKALAKDVYDLDLSLKTLETKGLVGAIQEIAEKTGGSAEAISQLFPLIRGSKAVMVLGRDSANEYSDALIKMRLAAGSNQQALDQMVKATKTDVEQLKSYWEDFKIVVGESISGAILPFINKLKGVIDSLSKLDDSWKKTIVGAGLTAVGFAGVGAAILTILSASVPLLNFFAQFATAEGLTIAMTNGLTVAFGGLKASLVALWGFLQPWILILGSLYIGYAALTIETDALAGSTDLLSRSVKFLIDGFQWLLSPVTDLLKAMAGLKDAEENITKATEIYNQKIEEQTDKISNLNRVQRQARAEKEKYAKAENELINLLKKQIPYNFLVDEQYKKNLNLTDERLRQLIKDKDAREGLINTLEKGIGIQEKDINVAKKFAIVLRNRYTELERNNKSALQNIEDQKVIITELTTLTGLQVNQLQKFSDKYSLTSESIKSALEGTRAAYVLQQQQDKKAGKVSPRLRNLKEEIDLLEQVNDKMVAAEKIVNDRTAADQKAAQEKAEGLIEANEAKEQAKKDAEKAAEQAKKDAEKYYDYLKQKLTLENEINKVGKHSLEQKRMDIALSKKLEVMEFEKEESLKQYVKDRKKLTEANTKELISLTKTSKDLGLKTVNKEQIKLEKEQQQSRLNLTKDFQHQIDIFNAKRFEKDKLELNKSIEDKKQALNDEFEKNKESFLNIKAEKESLDKALVLLDEIKANELEKINKELNEFLISENLKTQTKLLDKHAKTIEALKKEDQQRLQLGQLTEKQVNKNKLEYISIYKERLKEIESEITGFTEEEIEERYKIQVLYQDLIYEADLITYNERQELAEEELSNTKDRLGVISMVVSTFNNELGGAFSSVIGIIDKISGSFEAAEEKAIAFNMILNDLASLDFENISSDIIGGLDSLPVSDMISLIVQLGKAIDNTVVSLSDMFMSMADGSKTTKDLNNSLLDLASQIPVIGSIAKITQNIFNKLEEANKNIRKLESEKLKGTKERIDAEYQLQLEDIETSGRTEKEKVLMREKANEEYIRKVMGYNLELSSLNAELIDDEIVREKALARVREQEVNNNITDEEQRSLEIQKIHKELANKIHDIEKKRVEELIKAEENLKNKRLSIIEIIYDRQVKAIKFAAEEAKRSIQKEIDDFDDQVYEIERRIEELKDKMESDTREQARQKFAQLLNMSDIQEFTLTETAIKELEAKIETDKAYAETLDPVERIKELQRLAVLEAKFNLLRSDKAISEKARLEFMKKFFDAQADYLDLDKSLHKQQVQNEIDIQEKKKSGIENDKKLRQDEIKDIDSSMEESLSNLDKQWKNIDGTWKNELIPNVEKFAKEIDAISFTDWVGELRLANQELINAKNNVKNVSDEAFKSVPGSTKPTTVPMSMNIPAKPTTTSVSRKPATTMVSGITSATTSRSSSIAPPPVVTPKPTEYPSINKNNDLHWSEKATLAVGNFFGGVKKFFGFADGGVVPTVLHGGETVLNNKQQANVLMRIANGNNIPSSSNNMNFNVYIGNVSANNNSDVDRMVSKIEQRIADKFKKQLR